MAPMAPVNHDALEQQLKEALQSMYNIMVQTTAYDMSASSSSGGGSGSTATPSSSSNTSTATPPPVRTTTTTTSSSSSASSSRDVLAAELRALQQTLQAIHRASTPAHPANANLPHVPPELIQYVENGRNPDIYTREFVELVRRGNQLMKGKQDAFRAFRDVLAGEVAKAMPELREDVRRVVAATDGNAVEPQPAGAGAGPAVKSEAASSAA